MQRNALLCQTSLVKAGYKCLVVLYCITVVVFSASLSALPGEEGSFMDHCWISFHLDRINLQVPSSF